MNIQPLWDRILLQAVSENKSLTNSWIYLPESDKKEKPFNTLDLPLVCWKSIETGISLTNSEFFSLLVPFHLILLKCPSDVAMTRSSRTHKQLENMWKEILVLTSNKILLKNKQIEIDLNHPWLIYCHCLSPSLTTN